MPEKPTVACYYFPNYHVDPRNEAQHGEGWTEWELVRRAEPRFPGHEQPKAPHWGYEDEADPEVMARKIEAAAGHGIDAFIFDWYHYTDGPFLEGAIERGFFRAPNNHRIRFGLMWANHDWIDIHPAKRNVEPPLLHPGPVTPDAFDRITSLLVDTYFSHPSYWRIDGRPYFSIYDLNCLVRSFETVDDLRRALDAFREKVRAAGFPDLHLNAVVWINTILPREATPIDAPALVRRLGFDSATSYVWIHHVALDRFPRTPYGEVMEKYFAFAASAEDTYGIPYYPNVTMGWDASPRTVQSDVYADLGYPFMATLGGNTPAAFGDAVRRAREFLDGRPPGQRIFNINCWNEWTEGSYLEPDARNGFAYLEALRAALAEPSATAEA
jgi:hypothetical protein